jgi:CubicO group peptidase (beta-lactamase class C family)
MKAVTALVASVLAEEQVFDLDAPVRRYLPEVRLPDLVIQERMTTRDLLSHRSGLGQHDLVWIWDPALSDADLLERLAALPPAGDLRTGMNYSNFGYALVGQVIGRVTGSSWAEQVQSRLLDPCGMKQTVIGSFPDPDERRDYAVGHVLRDGRPVATRWRSIGAVAPAGQLVTCATDAATWLRLQLDAAAFDIPGVIQTAVAATHQPQVLLPPGASAHPEVTWAGYGLGWVTGSYRGRPVVWHSGGIDGFLTNTLLLPEQRIGITVSASLHMSDLAYAAVLQIADELTGTTGEQSWYDRVHAENAENAEQAAAAAKAANPTGGAAGERPPSQPLEAFAGSYRDNGYGELAITVEAERLRARIGAAELVLHHRHFDTWDAWYEPLDERFALTFVTDADGVVAEIVAGLDAATGPVRFGRQPAPVVPHH